VETDVGAELRERRAERVRVTDVQLLEPGAAVHALTLSRSEIVDREDSIFSPKERVDKVRADEARAACDHSPHGPESTHRKRRERYGSVVSFFEPPPLPPEPEPDDDAFPPDWIQAPRNQIGGPVPIRLLLARTENVAVAVLGGAAYPNGFEFRLAIRSRDEPQEIDPWEGDPFWSRRRLGQEGLPDELFRFGVEFSDGRRATTVSGPILDDEPEGPVLTQGGGGGGSGSWESEFWLWPLPPPGPLAFVCEWPARGIALTRAEVDAALVRDAAKQAETLWPPQPLRGGYHAYPMTALGPDRSATEDE
jgi:hypothetical protein